MLVAASASGVPAVHHQQPQAAGESSLVSSVLRVCNSATINFDESPANALRAIVGVCLKFIDNKALVESSVKGTFVDWSFVDEYNHPSGRPGNLLGDSTLWLRLLSYVSFPDTDLPELVIRRSYPPLWCIINAAKESRVYEPCSSPSRNRQAAVQTGSNGDSNKEQQQQQWGDGPPDCLTFSDVCKLCIAINLKGVQSR